MKRLPLILALLCLGTVLTAGGRNTRTTRSGLHRIAEPAPADTAEAVASAESVESSVIVRPDSTRLKIRGYDKPLRSRRESFFVVNTDTCGFDTLYLTLTYYDNAGRMLHRRSVAVEADVPAGETRNVGIPSWDRQYAFYYYLSPRPTRAAATPYRVTVSVDSVRILPSGAR